MNSEHVEVLREMLDDAAIEPPWEPEEVAAITAAIAALSAPQPPAEAQPVAWQFQDRDGRWHGFMDERHRLNTIADGSWPVRALYTAPPSASVGAEGHYRPCTSILIEGLKRLEGGSDVLEEWDRARVKVDTALAQQPAAPVLAKHQPCGCVICTCEDEQQCQGCGAKHCGNRADHPPYVGQQTAAVDDLMNAWRAAFITERATRYREGGMKIEQARIHAEADAARMAVLAAAQQQGGTQE